VGITFLHRTVMVLIAQCRKISQDVFDLFSIEQRLTAECRRYAIQTSNAVVRRHDGLWIDTAGINYPQPQLTFVGARSDACQIRASCALKFLLWERSSMAQQTKPDLPLDHDGAPLF